jgi:hypothetical protein
MEKAMECFPTPDGQVCINPPPILLASRPRFASAVADGRRVPLRDPVSAMACEVRISYQQNDPSHPTVARWRRIATAQEIELAIAVMLAKSWALRSNGLDDREADHDRSESEPAVMFSSVIVNEPARLR